MHFSNDTKRQAEHVADKDVHNERKPSDQVRLPCFEPIVLPIMTSYKLNGPFHESFAISKDSLPMLCERQQLQE